MTDSLELLATPNPATTDWVPIWDLKGMPAALPPVVNGQWIKGVGGAAVWAPITPADLTSMRTRIVAGQVAANGSVSAGTGFTVTHPGTGNYQITLAIGMALPVIVVTPLAQSVVAGGYFQSATTGFAYMTTPGAWTDSGFNFVVYDATMNTQ